MTPNTLYPGQPDYVGPDSGLACWVHHEQPIEYCTSFTERLAYIRAKKPAHEQAVRLAALTCLPLDRLPVDLIQAWTAFDQAWTAFNQTRTAYGPLLLALMAELVPSHLWNDHGLIFPQPGGQP